MFEKPNQQIQLHLRGVGCLMWDVQCLFCMGAYKCDVVQGMLILCRCLLSRYYRVQMKTKIEWFEVR